MHLLHALTLASLATLAACGSNPILPLEAAGFSSGVKGAAAQDLPGARALADTLRASYRDEIARQVAAAQFTNNGLLVLGSAVLGLAASNAHRDAILGVSLIGGTGYALANLNQDKRRLLILSNGIQALDCATGAVVPLDLGTERDRQIRDQLRQLRAGLPVTQAAAQSLRDALQRFGNQAGSSLEVARNLLKRSDAVLIEAATSRRAANAYTGEADRLGRQLVQTVKEISRQVDRAMVDTLVAVSAIPELVAGLGGFAGQFAPGAKLDAQFAGVFDKYNAAKQADAANKTGNVANASADLGDVEAAIKALLPLVEQLATASNELTDLLQGLDQAGTQAAAALKACHVADAITALSITPSTLDLVAGKPQARGIAISGGTKPYRVQMLDQAPDALTISFGGGFDDTARLQLSGATLGAEALGSYTVLVSDSASPRRNQPLTVNIVAAAAAAATPAASKTGAPADAAPADAGGGLAALAQALDGTKGQAVALNNVQLTLDSASFKTAPERIELALACTPSAPAKLLDAVDVKTKLTQGNPALAPAVKALLAQNKLDAKLSQLVFKPVLGNCIKP